MIMSKILRPLALLLISVAASCTQDGKTQAGSREGIQSAYLGGVRAALNDCHNQNAAILVHRAVKPGETDPQTGLPLRDAGIDIDPMRSAFSEGYNATISAVASAVGAAPAAQQAPTQSKNAPGKDEALILAMHGNDPQDLAPEDGEFEIRHGEILVRGMLDGKVSIAISRRSTSIFQDAPGTANLLDDRVRSSITAIPKILLLGLQDPSRRNQIAPVVQEVLDSRIVLFVGQTRSGRPISAALELSSHDRELLSQATGPRQ